MTFRAFAVAVMAAGCGAGQAASSDAGPASIDADIPPALPAFPAGFLWGTATSPYQAEGGLHQDDWYPFESTCPNCSKEHADDGPDFWNRYQVDVDNAAALGTNALRLGIDWSRVFPTRESFPGSPDRDAVAHYHDIFRYARSHGLQLMLTLHHFTNPVWLGSWEDAHTIDDFATWAGWAAAEYGGEVDLWITINEPMGYVIAGWIGAVFPPGKLGDIPGALTVAYNLIRAHARAYDAIAANDRQDADGDGKPALVSIASHNRVWLPMHAGDAGDQASAGIMRYLNNLMFIEAVTRGNIDKNFDGDFDDPGDVKGDPTLAGRLDFIGLNYYGVSLVVAGDPAQIPFAPSFQNDLDRFGLQAPISDFGGSIYPQGFQIVLDELHPYALPIYVTENGIADASDEMRPRFLMDHLYALGRAIQGGADVRGYFYWSITDNFEFAAGFCPEFGLFRVDRQSPDKTRSSGAGAEVYKEIIHANTVPLHLYEIYRDYPGSHFCPRIGI